MAELSAHCQASAPLPGDDDPIRLTRRQIQTADATLTAYLDDMWADSLPDFADLLKAGYMPELVDGGHFRGVPTIDEAAAKLDS